MRSAAWGKYNIFLAMHSFLISTCISITQINNNSRLQYINSDFNLDKATGQSYECIHTGTYNNDKLKHHDANIHNA